MSKKLIATTLFLATFSGGAMAMDATALFGGRVADTCILATGTPGTFTANSDFTNLSTDNAGGSESTVKAVATSSNYRLSTIAPSAFSAGDSSSVTFATDYSLTGATTANDIAGSTATRLTRGQTTVSVGLKATKTTGTFTAGDYAAAVTVRCE